MFRHHPPKLRGLGNIRIIRDTGTIPVDYVYLTFLLHNVCCPGGAPSLFTALGSSILFGDKMNFEKRPGQCAPHHMSCCIYGALMLPVR